MVTTAWTKCKWKHNSTFVGYSENCLDRNAAKYIALNAYIKKVERSRISHLSLHLRKLETEEQIKSKLNKIKEIIKE